MKNFVRKKVIIFDLDETLYSEIDYVISGFKVVAEYLECKYKLIDKKSFQSLKAILDKDGRGKVFDTFLQRNNIFSQTELKKCLSIYRSHQPNISLYNSAKLYLKKNYKEKSLYLVTDGNKITQEKKIKSLNIEEYFKKIFITHRYGTKNAKPSLYCFEIIKKIEGCDWADMIYIGDDPTKDFVSLNEVGAHTVRLLKGRLSKKRVTKVFDAKYKINDIEELEKIPIFYED